VTRRESIIVAFALAVTALAIVIVVGHLSIQVAPPNHLPALNQTPAPKPTPGGVGAPTPQPTPTAPAPTGAAPTVQAARTRLSSTGGQQSGASCRPSTSTGDSPRPSSGSSTGDQLLPHVRLPIVPPPVPPLPLPTP